MKKYYYVFLSGRFISSFGNWFLELSLPFVIYELTGSAMAVSMSFLLETLPIIILTSFTSYVVDQYSKKKILQISEILSGLILFLCVITRLDNIVVLYTSCLVLAVIGNLYNITINSYIPEISGNEDLTFANNLDSFVSNIAMIIGPVIAGICIKVYGSKVAFVLDGASFVLAAIIFLFLPNPTKTVEKRNQNGFRISEISLTNHLQILKGNNFLRNIMLICILFSTCGAIFSALDAVYVAEVFDSSSAVYGYINSAWGIGMIATSVLYFLYEKIPKIKVFIFGIICMGIATIGYGLSTTLFVCVIFNFLGGLANTLYVIYFRSLLQLKTPENDRGKVFTLQSSMSKCVSIIMVSIAGIAADIISVRCVIIFSGLMAIVVGFVCHRLLYKEVID